MNLKTISDSALVSNAEILVREEREKLTGFLHHLKEIERRRLFSALGFKSLFEMTVKHFGYSEDEAYRRLSAMNLLKEIPEVEQKINQGELTLTHLNLAQKHFRQEMKAQAKEVSIDQKLSLIERISKTSVREAEKITLSLSFSPEPVKADRVRLISDDQIEMRFSASSRTREKVERLKGWLAHKHPVLSLGELFELLCDLGIRELDPSKPVGAHKKSRVKVSKAQIRRDVFSNAQSKCENCGSSFALEVDHVRAKALGGDDSMENLRLLCRACNQRAAIQTFGVEKMNRHLDRHHAVPLA